MEFSLVIMLKTDSAKNSKTNLLCCLLTFQPTGFITLQSEMQAKYTYDNAMKIPYNKKDMLVVQSAKKQEQKAEQDWEEHIPCRKKGIKSNVFFGHGPTQETVLFSHTLQFEDRDFKTTNELFYGVREKSNTVMNPHYKPYQTRSVITFPPKTQVMHSRTHIGRTCSKGSA